MKNVSILEHQRNTINSHPELEILICSLHPDINDKRKKHIKDLAKKDIDWQYLYQIADKHGVLSILFDRFQQILSEEISHSLLSEWRCNFQKTAQRNLFLTSELIKLLNLFKEKNITALPYKGPVLANLLYQNVALRRFEDLDIMVNSQDIFAVRELLITQGYIPKIRMTDGELVKYLNSPKEHTYDFINRQKGIYLEIHWRVAPKYTCPIEAKDLWSDLEPFPFAGTTINNLPWEDWLPILCIHASRHMWEKFSWLCDIAMLIHRNPKINWEIILERANTWGCRRILCSGLYMTHDLFDIDLPIEIWQQIKKEEAIISSIATQAYQQLFAEVRTSDKFMRRTFYQIQVKENFQHKFLYIQSFLDWLVRSKNK